MPSVKKNFLYSSILTSANYIFVLLTYPYVSRVLGVDKIGAVSFADSIINYFILLSTLGIGVVGIREIAAACKDKDNFSKVFSSLLMFNAATTVVALVVLCIATLTVPLLRANYELMCVGACKLIFNFLLIEWFYKGLENFKYITLRTILIRTAYVVAIFIFIKEPSDYKLYYLLTCSTIAVNATINLAYSGKFAKLRFAGIDIGTYFKPIFQMGIYLVLTSMYTTFNIVFLGFVASETEVGYYTTATKLYNVFGALFTAFTGVMLPRMSSLLVDNRREEFIIMIHKSIEMLISFAIPAIMFSEVFAPALVHIISGHGYDGAITPMRIVMPLIFVVSYEQILVIQILIALKKDNVILRNSVWGACFSLLANIAVVPMLLAVGSAIIWLASELLILILSQVAVRQIICLSFPYRAVIKALIIYAGLALALYPLCRFIENEYSALMLGAAVSAVYFIMTQKLFYPDGYALQMIHKYIPVKFLNNG